jgi:hypothetical protein
MRNVRFALGVLAVLVLAAVPARAAGPAGDHYFCYKSVLTKGEPKFTAATKHLKDQLEDKNFDAKKTWSLCTPATKTYNATTSTPTFPAVHLQGYQIKQTVPPKPNPPQPKFVPSNHTTVDQFGSLNITAKSVDSLLVRAGKTDLGQVNTTNFPKCSATIPCAGGSTCQGGACIPNGFPTAPADNVGVNNYKCYKIVLQKGSKFTPIKGGLVQVSDQFTSPAKKYDVTKPTKLCDPVDKDGENPGAETNPNHLVCYATKLTVIPKASGGPQPKYIKHRVAVANTNFSPNRHLDATKLAELCVPALKDPPPTTTTTTTTTTITVTTTTTTTTTTTSTTTTSTSTTTTSTTTTTLIPGTLKLTTTAGTGNCGVSRDDAGGAGTILKNLSCGGLDIGGGNNLTPVGEGPTPSGATNLYAVGSCAGTVCPISQKSTAPAANSADPDCSALGCNFGTPLPIVNGSTSTCVVNKFHANASGTIDIGNGNMNLGVDLDSHIFLTGDIQDSGSNPQVCPICQGGTCTTGPNHGLACTSTNPNGLTRDCPPGAGADEGTCTNGTNGGKFCHVSTQVTDCPGGDESCQAPFDFGSPGLHVDLTPFQTGTSSKSNVNGLFCPGQINKHRGCFNKPSSAADLQVCRFISETGSPATGGLVTGGPAKPAKIGSVFCIPATGNPLIDDLAAGLPGPGATALVYSAQLLP